MTGSTGDRFFYNPTREVYANPADDGLVHEPVAFCSEGTRLDGWFLPARGEAKGTVIHCHGNGGNITGHFRFIAWMPPMGWNVLCFDYRGFGASHGRPTRAGTIADAHAAIDYARSRDDVDACRVVILGQSLGGAVGIVAAAERNDLCGLVIEGAFSTYRRAAAYVCEGTWMPRGLARPIIRALFSKGHEPIDHVPRIAPTPTLFITGTVDTMCDCRQTIELHQAAGDPKSLWIIDGGQHTSALVDTNGEGKSRVHTFFDECVRAVDRSQPAARS